MSDLRALFITNWCPHYRVRTFETLAQRADIEFVFFSAGNEWYWGQRHGKQVGDFPHEYLWGFNVTPWFRVTPRLVRILMRFRGDVILKCITGRFALPVSLMIAKLRRKPFVLWTGIWQHPQTLFHRLTFPITRMVYRSADAIVVYGEHVKRYLISLGVPAEGIFVAHHAVDNDLYGRDVPRAECEELAGRLGVVGRRVVLYVGRLEESKGLGVLIAAFNNAELDDATLVLVGQGSMRTELERRVAALGIADRVVFAGYVSPSETVTYYALATIVALASVSVRAGKEPWGLVVNEAMNQGTPVIATDAVGAAAGGLVQDMVTGRVVPEGDVAELSRAIAHVMDDRGLLDQMGANAKRVIAHWDNEGMATGFIEALDYAVGKHG